MGSTPVGEVGLDPGPITQTDTSGLGKTHCIEVFYSKDQTDQLLADHDANYQKKLDAVKRDYVDKISSLSPEVLAAIKEEVKQQLMSELVPQIREEIKNQLQQESLTKAAKSGPKTSTRGQQPASKSAPIPPRAQD